MFFPPTEILLIFIYFYKKEGMICCTALNDLCLEASAKLRKAFISFVLFVSLCPSIRMEKLDSHETDIY